MALAMVPAAPPTRKNQRATSWPAPISASVPYITGSRLTFSALKCVSTFCCVMAVRTSPRSPIGLRSAVLRGSSKAGRLGEGRWGREGRVGWWGREGYWLVGLPPPDPPDRHGASLALGIRLNSCCSQAWRSGVRRLWWVTSSKGISGQIRMEEETRLNEPASRGWKTWGPYLSERQWGTVREDYSPDGTAWESFSHDTARSR